MDTYWRGRRKSPQSDAHRQAAKVQRAKTHFSRIPQHLQWFSSLSQRISLTLNLSAPWGFIRGGGAGWGGAPSPLTVPTLCRQPDLSSCRDIPESSVALTGSSVFLSSPLRPSRAPTNTPPIRLDLNPAGRQIWKTSAGWRSKGEAKACCNTPLPAGFKLSS